GTEPAHGDLPASDKPFGRTRSSTPSDALEASCGASAKSAIPVPSTASPTDATTHPVVRIQYALSADAATSGYGVPIGAFSTVDASTWPTASNAMPPASTTPPPIIIPSPAVASAAPSPD